MYWSIDWYYNMTHFILNKYSNLGSASQGRITYISPPSPAQNGSPSLMDINFFKFVWSYNSINISLYVTTSFYKINISGAGNN